LEFSSLAGLNFKVPYLIYDGNGGYVLNFLDLDKYQKGKIDILKFGAEKTSLIIIPSLQSKISTLDFGLTYPYTFSISITSATQEIPSEDQVLIEKLLAQIEFLKKEILRLQTQQGKTNPNNMYCFQIENNLYFGMQANAEVKCLQEFLKNQGQDIYPEGLVTGNFGNLTKRAVIKFQEKYKISGTGYVGSLTRAKVNDLLTR
jgi:peptidoglycan hydrolase-like protein with peptidoglycan-binding domain